MAGMADRVRRDVNMRIVRRSPKMAVALLISVVAVWLSDAPLAQAENICEREMHRASARYGVPLGILYAVGLTETGRKNSLQPYAMNIEGKA
ncbi:lytic transglycosylase catalytic, partial [Brucella abortus bv. 2 str. 86/8/59]